MKNLRLYLILMSLTFFINQSFTQNPVIQDQFTADPSARVFNGKVYVYPSHDILAKEGRGRPGWFCMEDYHVFSSDNLTNWTDHGVIVSQNKVNWVDTATYSMWAPDCILKNGKYYFYFPANEKDREVNGRKVFSIGVAIADNPEGPFVPQPEPIKGVTGIDPNVFIDKDGKAYLYYSLGRIFAAKLKDNMLELESEPIVISEMPSKGLIEGPWLFERNGLYYMTYPHVENKIERIEYAIGDNPMGPFKYAGVIMDESPMNCWTNHQSIFEYKDQWYLFYHQNPLSPKFDKARSICIDSLFFNGDGTIRKVNPTWRGAGLSRASQKIEIDRYSSISQSGSSVEFIDTTNRFIGWKTILAKKDAWIQYNAIDFGTKKPKIIRINARTESGGKIQIRLNNANGPLLSQVTLPKNNQWNIASAKVKEFLPGVQNLVVLSTSDDPVEIDWLSFK
jgi:hypothetical protein